MTRRGPASRRPPRLDDRPAPPPSPPAPRRPQPPEQRLARAHVAGRSLHIDAAAVAAALRALASGDVTARYGLPVFTDLTTDEARAAAALVYGWPGSTPAAHIDSRRTTEAAAAAAARVREVATAGDRIALATARPASLLGVLGAWAVAARDAGAEVLAAVESDAFRADGRAGRRVWWVGDVAVVSDGHALLPVVGTEAADEWLFTIGRPKLVVADRGFAGAALAAGIETVAFAGLDAPVFAVAAARGLPCTVVPLDDSCPPGAYEPIAQLIAAT